MPRTTFLYHTEAVGLSGKISLPVAETIPLQASIASGIGESYGKVRVDNFKHLEYLTVGAIESHVVSSFSDKDNAFGTMSSVVIDELNTMNVVTCGRLMTRLTSKHNNDNKSPGSFILHGTHFDDIRIAGHRFDFDLAVGLFSELSTWEKLMNAYDNNPSIRRELDELALYPKTKKDGRLPLHQGVFSCTLAKIPKKLPRGMSHAPEQGIYVPHFGTVYPAHYYITATSRRLHMLHVDLGCSVEGCNSYGSGGANGQQLPGNP
jgi:hypothetical protein